MPLNDGKPVTAVQDQPAGGLDFRISPYKKGWWKSYSHTDGLADDSVVSVFQAANGALWFGCKGGVSRFDGVKFTNLTTRDGLPDTHVSSIVEAECGSMLFGTPNGLWQYEPKSPGPKLHTFGWDSPEKRKLLPLELSQTTNDSGRVVMKTGEGDKVAPLPAISGMTKDREGRIWLAFGNALWRSELPFGKAGSQTFTPALRKTKGSLPKDTGPSAHHGVLHGSAEIVAAEIPGLAGDSLNRVLLLNGSDGYLGIPSHIFDSLTQATVEGWVNWKRHNDTGRFFDFGDDDHEMYVRTSDEKELIFLIAAPDGTRHRITAPGVPGRE